MCSLLGGDVMKVTRIIAFCLSIALLPLPVSLGMSQTGSQEDPHTILLRAVQLVRKGQYTEAASNLEKYVQLEPENVSGRCLLAVAYFRAQRNDKAVVEFKSIQKLPSGPDSDNCLKKLAPLISPELNRELEKSLDSRLAELKSEEAIAIVDTMYLEPQQRELLKYSINLWQGNLANAFSRLATIRMMSPDGSVEPLQKKVTEEVAFFQKVKGRLDWYRYSAITNGTCTPESLVNEEREQVYSLQQYAALVADAEQHFPLNSWVLDQAFFATLLLKPYEDTESLGDKVLGAKGTLHIPFYARDSLYDLVIDSRNHRLRTEIDTRVSNNEAGDGRMLELVPFDIEFEQITSLSQKAQADVLTHGLGKQSYALKMEPAGTAPYYAFMDAIHCMGGEAAQKTITANLGRFILHVIKNSKVSVHLVNPESKTRDWLSASTAALAIGTVAASQFSSTQSNKATASQSQAISANAMRILAENRREAEISKDLMAVQGEQNERLHAQVSQIVFSEIPEERVVALEKFEHQLLAMVEASVKK